MNDGKEYYVDYRFIVKAFDKPNASDKVLAFLPEATDDIWYTIIRIRKRRKILEGTK